MRFDTLIEALFDVDLDDVTQENVAVECPNCGRNKLYIHREKGLGHCMYGDFDVNAVQLLRSIKGISLEAAVEELARIAKAHTKILDTETEEADPNAHVYLTILRALRGEAKPAPKSCVALPDGLVPILDSPRGRRYLRSRGFKQADYAPYRLLFCPPYVDAWWSGHIVFPNYTKRDTINFWTTRAAFEPKVGKKSYNPGGVKRGGILYGAFCLRNPRRRLFICEGPLDCIALRQEGVALLGKTISDEQCQSIARMRPKQVYVVLDAEARVDCVKAAAKLAGLLDHDNVYYASLDDDPAKAKQSGTEDVCEEVVSRATRLTATSVAVELLRR